MTMPRITMPRASSAGATAAGLSMLGFAWLFSSLTAFVAIATAAIILTSVRPRAGLINLASAGLLIINTLVVETSPWWSRLIPDLIEPVSADINAVSYHTFVVGQLYADFFFAPLEVPLDLMGLAGFSVPVGMMIGTGLLRWVEYAAADAEWNPLVQRRALVKSLEDGLAVIDHAYDRLGLQSCSAMPLGVARDGDLLGWNEGPYLVVPRQHRGLGITIAGDPGSGKTSTLERKIAIDAAYERQVIFVDCKGTDPRLADRIEASYLSARPDARVIRWPDQPLNAWIGEPQAVANRLIQMQDYTEEFYKQVGEGVVRLVLQAPDLDGRGPCRSSADFLERMSADYLRRAYEGTPDAALVASLARRPETFDGVRMRYGNFFAALGGAFDGEESFDDADLVLLRVPTLSLASDAAAAVRMALADFGHYATVRKPRIGRDVTFVVDEFSAVTAASPLVANLAERVRDVGCQMVVSVQSWEGMGADEDERQRLLTALAGGVILHRMPAPERFLFAAGTRRETEQSVQLDGSGSTAMGNITTGFRMKIRPDEVRRARTGEAWLIFQGQYRHFFVVQNEVRP